MAQKLEWIELSAYATEQPLLVRVESVEAVVGSEWGATLYLKGGETVSVSDAVKEIIDLVQGK